MHNIIINPNIKSIKSSYPKIRYIIKIKPGLVYIEERYSVFLTPLPFLFSIHTIYIYDKNRYIEGIYIGIISLS